MEIDPDLYESSPQQTSHPLFAHREPQPIMEANDLLAYALDLLCYPVMSAECERVFTGAKLLISPNRNRLADYIIEAAECLRTWWIRGIIEE